MRNCRFDLKAERGSDSERQACSVGVQLYIIKWSKLSDAGWTNKYLLQQKHEAQIKTSLYIVFFLLTLHTETELTRNINNDLVCLFKNPTLTWKAVITSSWQRPPQLSSSITTKCFLMRRIFSQADRDATSDDALTDFCHLSCSNPFHSFPFNVVFKTLSLWFFWTTSSADQKCFFLGTE